MDLDIPKDFNSDSDDQPFTACKVCERDLSKGEVPYSIEKAYKRVDEDKDVTLFEVAICMPCAEKQAEKMSKESRAYLMRSEEHTSELQSRPHLVCRLLLEKKKKKKNKKKIKKQKGSKSTKHTKNTTEHT